EQEDATNFSHGNSWRFHPVEGSGQINGQNKYDRESPEKCPEIVLMQFGTKPFRVAEITAFNLSDEPGHYGSRQRGNQRKKHAPGNVSPTGRGLCTGSNPRRTRSFGRRSTN